MAEAARAHVGEDGFLDHVLVVRADADADVEVAGERELGGCAGGLEIAVFAGDEGVEKVAAFFDADGFGRGDVGFDFMGVDAGARRGTGAR